MTKSGKIVKENLYQIHIKDNGIGIDEEKKEKLFSPDHYITLTGTDGEIGTGLGLTLCKDFVNRNGGDIYAENNQNETGATFSFTIPIGL